MSRKHRSGLEKKIRKIQTSWDGQTRIIPFCHYKKHPGVIQGENYLKCRERKCWHYYEFRIIEENKKYKK